MIHFATRQIYTLDAIGSLVIGIVLVAFAAPVGNALGPALGATVLTAIGLGLVPWAAFNYWVGRTATGPRQLAIWNLAGDTAWIVANVALLLVAGSALSGIGVAAVCASIGFVLVVWTIKLYGLTRR